MLTLNIPTINDNPRDFDKLFELWNSVQSYVSTQKRPVVAFDFSRCRFLRPNAAAFLGGLARFIHNNYGTPEFLWHTIIWTIRTNLQKSGFEGNFGGNYQITHGNTVPYREDNTLSTKDSIINYLTHDWLGPGWVNVSEKLGSAIVGRTYEIYWNALEHSHSPIGVFSCGQRYPQKKELILTVVDFGVGIPYHVRNFLNKPELGADKALKWAFQEGNTTVRDTCRGLGLGLLKEFVFKNEGKIEVYSHDGYAVINNEVETYAVRSSHFPGTVLNIKFNCDNNFYCFANEHQGDLFEED